MRAIKLRTVNNASLLLLKVLFVYPFKLASLLVRKVISLILFLKRKASREKEDELDIMGKSTEVQEIANESSECPEFSEIFNLDKDSIIGVEYVARVPDETAFIRIVGNESISKQFRRKVYTKKGRDGGRYIKVDDKKFYLKKTVTKAS